MIGRSSRNDYICDAFQPSREVVDVAGEQNGYICNALCVFGSSHVAGSSSNDYICIAFKPSGVVLEVAG